MLQARCDSLGTAHHTVSRLQKNNQLCASLDPWWLYMENRMKCQHPLITVIQLTIFSLDEGFKNILQCIFDAELFLYNESGNCMVYWACASQHTKLFQSHTAYKKLSPGSHYYCRMSGARIDPTLSDLLFYNGGAWGTLVAFVFVFMCGVL